MKSFISQLFILFIFFSCLYTQETGTLNKDIDQYFNNFMDVYGVPGAALAIIKDDKIIFKKYYKTANIEFNVPVNINTLFQLSSLTKIFTATAIFQLIEKQQINLNENISAYIYELPANWQSIKVKHLLTHSSGLPEISLYDKFPEDSAKSLVYKDDILCKAGDKSRYTNTNFWLLQKIIENVTNHKLVDYVLKNQFSTCKKTAIYSGDFREIVSNRATSYEPDDNNFFRLRNYKFPQYLYGAAGLNLTLDCLIKWNEDLDNNILISEKNKFKMWSPYKLNNGELSPFSYGWHIRRPNNRSAIGFSGGYTTGMRKYLDDDLTIILLTNGYKNRYNIERVIEYLAGLVSENLKDNESTIYIQLVNNFLNQDSLIAIQNYKFLKNKYPNNSYANVLNSIGYELLRLKQYYIAIKVFKLNIDENLNSWNAYDSLGEAYELIGNTTGALKNYKKSFKLNPDNENAESKIKLLDKLSSKE